MNTKVSILSLFLIAVAAAAVIYLNLPSPPENFEQKFMPIPVPKKSQPAPKEPFLQNKQVWGAYTGNTADSLLSFEKQVGRQPDISAIFLDWGRSFPTNLANPVKARGRTLLIYWEPNSVDLDEILGGEQDTYIKEFVMQAQAYKNPVILVPFHEMNGNWSAWAGTVGNNNPQKIILAWRRMHDLFAKASNVKWGWAVNNVSVPDTAENDIANYYPGDNYVDYVGVDGFNFGDPWQTYSEIFASSLNKLRQYNKKIYIFSMASAQGPKKAAWIADALNQIKSDPNIAGWIWFNENKEQNWLINSDLASLRAFQSGI